MEHWVADNRRYGGNVMRRMRNRMEASAAPNDHRHQVHRSMIRAGSTNLFPFDKGTDMSSRFSMMKRIVVAPFSSQVFPASHTPSREWPSHVARSPVAGGLPQASRGSSRAAAPRHAPLAAAEKIAGRRHRRVQVAQTRDDRSPAQSGDALISLEPRAFRFSAQRSHAAAFGSN